MQLVIPLIAAFAASAYSSPTHVNDARSCSWSQCVVALSPAALLCLPAGAELELDFMFDAGCLAAVGYDIVDAPGVCNGCIGITTNSKGSTLSSIESSIKSAAHKIAHKIAHKLGF